MPPVLDKQVAFLVYLQIDRFECLNKPNQQLKIGC